VLLTALTLVWAVAIATGLAMVWNYESAPGTPATPPERWPIASPLTAASDRPTLVMMVHPHCPCSRASLEELDRVVAQVGDRVAVEVLFVKPPDLGQDWVRTDLWERASAIRGVTVRRDDDGIEARRFASFTSGQTILYDRDGRLLFSGGITASRGHAGDNLGESTIVALLTQRTADTRTTPVFGCPLHDDDGRTDAGDERL
jgi:hypothetical protein